VKDLFDDGTPDALYLCADFLERGGSIGLRRRSVALPDDPPLLDAADYEAVPGKVLCIVRRPEWDWQKNAAAWIDLDQLGLRLERDACLERPFLFDELMATLD
jgi:hypothetical protein